MHTGLWPIFPKHFSDLTYLPCISFQKLCNQASYVCTVLIWDGWVGPSIGKHNTQALPGWKFWSPREGGQWHNRAPNNYVNKRMSKKHTKGLGITTQEKNSLMINTWTEIPYLCTSMYYSTFLCTESYQQVNKNNAYLIIFKIKFFMFPASNYYWSKNIIVNPTLILISQKKVAIYKLS